MVVFKVESVMAAGLNTDYVKVTVEYTPTGPPTAHNVFGWAWSDNIGWISFTCDNPEFPDCTNDYGVDIDGDTGIFSGYAWSDNIGWIDFSPSGPYPEIITEFKEEGPNNPSSAVDDDSVGTLVWSNPTNVYTSNDSVADVGDMSSGYSHYLKATSFGFSIPSNATIEGITVDIERSKMDLPGLGVVSDENVRIVKEGAIGSENKAVIGGWPVNDTYKSYGGSADLWSESWTASNINSNNFGVVISVVGIAGSIGWDATIDHIRITVDYTISTFYSACLDFPGVGQICDGVGDYKVSGWARTVNTGDGWDGWINLRDDAVYADGVFLNDSTNEFEGWAWSDDFGWISFNCITDGTSDYRVSYSPPPNQPPTCTSLSALPTEGGTPLDVSFTGEASDSDGTIVQYEFDFGEGLPFTTSNNTADHTYNSAGTYCAKLRVQDDDGDWSETPGACPDICAEQIVVELNSPPTAAFSCQIVDCMGEGCVCDAVNWVTYNGEGVFYQINNSSIDAENNIVRSSWSIIGWQDPFFDCPPGDILCSMTIPKIPAGNYTVKLEVEDAYNLTETITHPIIIRQDVIADFRCSLDSEGPWSDCDGFGLSEGEVIYFNSEYFSSPSNPSSGTSIISWSWTFVDGTPPTSDLQNSSSIFEALSSNSGEITLTITDTAGRSKTIDTYKLIIKLPLPEWREVSPF